VLLTLSCVTPLVAQAAPPLAPPMRLEQLTFVSSREDRPELRVTARAAVIDENANRADLETVDADWADDRGRRSLRVVCERGELDLTTNDLLASGDVRGELGDGRRFVGTWLRYDRQRGVAFTDAPVQILEGGGRVLRGGGLEYHVRERRLRLLSGARVEENRSR
jgi:LPS export ABC transporter protein LptC